MNRGIFRWRALPTGMIMCHIMVSRLFSFITWALCAMGVAYWGMAWFASPLHAPPHTVSVGLSDMPKTDPQRLLSLSAQAAAPEESSVSQSAVSQRVQLVGLMAGTPNHTDAGIALLVVDGKPAKAFRVGQSIDGELTILSISRQGVTIGLPGDQTGVTLDAQSLPPPNTGVLPSINSNFDQTTPNTPVGLRSPSSRAGMERNRPFPSAPPSGFQRQPEDIPPESTL